MMTSFIIGLLATTCFSVVVGIERELRDKPAGLKTFVILCLGSYLLGHISTYTTWDPMRLAVGVVTGVGFLGAGTLIKDDSTKHVEGLTTAAVIWASSAVSLTFGLGYTYQATLVAVIIGLMLTTSDRIKSVMTYVKGVSTDDT